jgi:hypothetical protein
VPSHFSLNINGLAEERSAFVGLLLQKGGFCGFFATTGATEGLGGRWGDLPIPPNPSGLARFRAAAAYLSPPGMGFARN